MKSLLQAVVECYLSSDDRLVSLRQVVAEFVVTHLKARKMLITMGTFHSDISDEITKLKSIEKTIPKIIEITWLCRVSIHSYLPYSKSYIMQKN